MSLRDSPIGDAKAPLTWIAAVALAVAAVAAFAVLLGDHRQSAPVGIYAASRKAVDSVVGPIGGVISAPIRWAGDGVAGVRSYFFAVSENRRLKVELAQARGWKDQALALQDENARYRALMGVKTDPPLPMVLARTMIDARGPFSNTRLADAGDDRGVIEGNPVLSEHGLVGRIVGVAPTVSRILLLTDVESRTPVLIARTNGRAILTGDGGQNPQLTYLRTHDALREGDRILTSGDGGVLPRGLPVGSAVKSYDGLWRVALDSDATPIDFVQILLFKDFGQLAAPGALAARALPSNATEAAGALAPPTPAPPPKPLETKPKPKPKPKRKP